MCLKIAQRSPNTPKRTTKDTQGTLRRRKVVPKYPQDTPRAPQRSPKGAQGSPKTTQREPKGSPRIPKGGKGS